MLGSVINYIEKMHSQVNGNLVDSTFVVAVRTQNSLVKA